MKFNKVSTPSAPTSISLTSKGVVSWSGASNATSYTVQYRLSTSSTWSTAASNVTGTSYDISSKLTNGKSYYARISASNSAGTSGYKTLTSAVLFNKSTSTALKPDLQASNGGSLSSSSVTKGSTFNLKTGKIKNVGNTTAAAKYTITVYASTDSTVNTSDIKLKTYTASNSLAAGNSTSLDINSISTNALTAGKIYYIGWIISGVTGETVTSNNTAYCTQRLTVNNSITNSVKKINTGDVLSFQATEVLGNTVYRSVTLLSNGKVQISDKTSPYNIGVPFKHTSYSAASITYSGSKATIKYKDSTAGYHTFLDGRGCYIPDQDVTITVDFSKNSLTYTQTSAPASTSSFTFS